MADKAKQVALVSYFEKAYEIRHHQKPTINRYSARWVFDTILGHMSEAEARSLIDYYFTTVSVNGHTLDWFSYNYDKLIRAKQKMDEDRTRLQEIRRQTRIRTEEWRKRVGNDTGTTD